MNTANVHALIDTGLTPGESAVTQMMALHIVQSGAPRQVLRALFDAVEIQCEQVEASTCGVYEFMLYEIEQRLAVKEKV